MVFIDAINVKIREGKVANRPIYMAVGVTVDGERDVLGLWAGEGGEGAKYWAHVLTEIKNRGTDDVCIVVCDGLTGLGDAVGAGVAPGDRADLCRPPDQKLVPLRLQAGLAGDRQGPQAHLHSADRGGRRWNAWPTSPGPGRQKYPAIVKLWENAWAEFVPFLNFHPEVRTVIYTTNAIESHQRPDPQGRQGPGTFPDRDRRHEMCVPGGHESRPHRRRPQALDHPVEAGIECLYY